MRLTRRVLLLLIHIIILFNRAIIGNYEHNIGKPRRIK